jgi:hypothetical protein
MAVAAEDAGRASSACCRRRALAFAVSSDFLQSGKNPLYSPLLLVAQMRLAARLGHCATCCRAAQDFRAEVAIMKRLKHPNVVRAHSGPWHATRAIAALPRDTHSRCASRCACRAQRGVGTLGATRDERARTAPAAPGPERARARGAAGDVHGRVRAPAQPVHHHAVRAARVALPAAAQARRRPRRALRLAGRTRSVTWRRDRNKTSKREVPA